MYSLKKRLRFEFRRVARQLGVTVIELNALHREATQTQDGPFDYNDIITAIDKVHRAVSDEMKQQTDRYHNSKRGRKSKRSISVRLYNKFRNRMSVEIALHRNVNPEMNRPRWDEEDQLRF